MTGRDELLARLTAERFTKHERVTEWHGDEPETATEAWNRLKELRKAAAESPYKQGVLDELDGRIEAAGRRANTSRPGPTSTRPKGA